MEEVFEILEGVNFVLLALALGLNIYVIRTFGKGLLNIIFISITFSIFFLAAFFVFHDFAHDLPFYMFSEATMHIWGHLIVFLSMISLIWGGYRIKGIVSSGNIDDMGGFGMKDKTFFSVLVVCLLFILTASPALESVFGNTAAALFIDKWGLHHFMVFILGGISVWYLMFIRGNWGLLSNAISSLIGYLFFLGLQHFWETITESWKLIEVTEPVIEGVEIALVIMGLTFLCKAQWRIIKFIKG